MTNRGSCVCKYKFARTTCKKKKSFERAKCEKALYSKIGKIKLVCFYHTKTLFLLFKKHMNIIQQNLSYTEPTSHLHIFLMISP